MDGAQIGAVFAGRWKGRGIVPALFSSGARRGVSFAAAVTILLALLLVLALLLRFQAGRATFDDTERAAVLSLLSRCEELKALDAGAPELAVPAGASSALNLEPVSLEGAEWVREWTVEVFRFDGKSGILAPGDGAAVYDVKRVTVRVRPRRSAGSFRTSGAVAQASFLVPNLSAR